jgi:hypothetical protein
MAMNADTTAHTGGPEPYDEERLPCGRTLTELFDVFDAPPDGARDPHTRTCPHCSAALEELAELRVRVDRAHRTGPPAPYDPAGLVSRVMDVVRTELRPGCALPLGEPEENLWLTESAAAVTLREAAETVPGVRAGSCRVQPGEAAEATVRLEIAVPLSVPVRATAEAVRRAVLAAAGERLGLAVATVDVRVIDIGGPERGPESNDGTSGGDGR